MEGKRGGGGGGEENCNREIRGGIDGFIRQDDTEVRVHHKGWRRSGRGQMDDCNEGEDGEEMSDGRERWGGGARHSEVREGMDQCEKEEREGKEKGREWVVTTIEKKL